MSFSTYFMFLNSCKIVNKVGYFCHFVSFSCWVILLDNEKYTKTFVKTHHSLRLIMFCVVPCFEFIKWFSSVCKKEEAIEHQWKHSQFCTSEKH